MTTVPLTLASTAEFQNLVVKGQSTFEHAFFNVLHAGLVDGTNVTIDTLTVNTLNQANSVGNPFVGVTLAPNELIALTSTRTLTTYPYSQLATDETVIQRTPSNNVNANYMGGSGSSNQLVLGTSPSTITFNSVANGFSGDLTIGTGTSTATQLTLSGSSSVVNSRAGSNKIVISDENTNPMTIKTLVDVATGGFGEILFSTAGTPKWCIQSIDLGGGNSRLEFQQGAPGGTAMLRCTLLNASDPVEMNNRLIPNIAATYNLGTSSNRWAELYLTTQSLTNVGGSANFTTNPATGMGTTTALGTGAQAAVSTTFTDTNLLVNSPIFVAASGYGGTTGIPMFQYNNTTASIIIMNAHTSQALNGTGTFSFAILNGNGNGA
jgi:hypothetical protein